MRRTARESASVRPLSGFGEGPRAFSGDGSSG